MYGNRQTLTLDAGRVVLLCAPGAAAQAPSPSDEEKNLQAYVGLLRSDVRKAESQAISEVMQFDTGHVAKLCSVSAGFERESSFRRIKGRIP
jgi:hypothetical protein